MTTEVYRKSEKAYLVSRQFGIMSRVLKDQALDLMAKSLIDRQSEILEANQRDLTEGLASGLNTSLLDRLTLNPARIKEMAEGLIVVRDLPDPIGDILCSWSRPNGLAINKVRVPLGVIAIIYEARPNVTVDAIGLALKSGNAVVLRGSGTALNSNRKLIEVLKDSMAPLDIPQDGIQLIEDINRVAVNELMELNQFISVIIPRGGAGLIQNVVKNATVPVLETGAGICHVYVDASADLDKAVAITFNSKVQRPSVCNAADVLLVHSSIAPRFIPLLFPVLRNAGVEIRGDESICKLDSAVKLATSEDWDTEYMSLILAVKIVSSVDEAIEHIFIHGTKHTEAIVSSDTASIAKFQSLVDASTVMVNCSTRFTDGGEFGFGAEIGISTQKLHARGPMGLPELTTYKYLVMGDGQVRG